MRLPLSNNRAGVYGSLGVAFAGFTFKTALTAAQGDDPYPLRDSFILDSGANWHFCNNRNRFVTFDPMEVETGVFAGDTKITIRGIGEVHLRIKDRIFILKEVFYTRCVRVCYGST